jgi:hypothetical protein
MSNNVNYAKFASMTPTFFGADARMVIMFVILFMFHMRWWTFALFCVVFSFSFFLEYKKINFIQFLKIIRMSLFSGEIKKIRKRY